jgi:acetyltransferase-like isoleucine patch superfamily enzyme
LSNFLLLKVPLRALFGYFKYLRLKLQNNKFSVGENFYCASGCRISSGRVITIGANFYMGHSCHLAAPAVIGDNVIFASEVALVGGDHAIDYISVPIRYSGRSKFRKIIISDNILD